MTTTTTTTLPEPECYPFDEVIQYAAFKAYTKDQMIAYGQQCRDADTELLKQCLDALEESLELVVLEAREYEKWHGTRRAKIDGMKQYAAQHQAVIIALRERLK